MKSEQKKTSYCAERIYQVKEILCHNRLCQPEVYLISIYGQKKKSACAFFLKIVRYHLQRNFFSWIFFFLLCVWNTHTKKNHSTRQNLPNALFYWLLYPHLRKKIRFKLKVLSQEQSLTPPILFKLSSLSSSKRHWAQRKSIKNPCA